MNVIYHLVLPDEWCRFETLDFFEAPSFRTEGFIHCSYLPQLNGVVARYYAHISEIILLTIDPALLTAPLILESAKNGEVYPHIYGKINKAAIVEAKRRTILNRQLM